MASLSKITFLTILQEIENTFSFGEKVPVRADEGVAKKESSPNLTQRLRRSPLFQRTKVIPGIMDSATSPSAPRRMTRWEANYED